MSEFLAACGWRCNLRWCPTDRQCLRVLRRVCRAPVHRAGDGLEYPGRLHRLRQFRGGGVLRSRAYCTVVLHKTVPSLPLPVMMLAGGAISGLIGLGMGYLTLRLRGTFFFDCHPSAMAVVAQTLITNWNFVGGSRGAYIIPPRQLADLPAVTTSNTCFWSCCCCPCFPLFSREQFSTPDSATASRQFATTSWRPRPREFQPCG